MRKKNNKKIIIVTVLALVITGGAVFGWSKNHKDISHIQSQTKKTSNSKEKSSSSSEKKTSKGGSVSGSAQAARPVTNPSHPQAQLAKPTGQVLNKFSISLSSSNPQTSPDMNSTCQTVFGASCGVRLTSSNGTIKTVTPQAVNDQGAVNLDWNARAIGLSPGTWRAQLIATKNGQIGLSDPYNLTVNP